MNLSDEILNSALNFSMEFGINWLTDIDDRLADKFPELTKSDLKTCDKLCRELTQLAHSHIGNNPVLKNNKLTFMEHAQFRKFVIEKYSWVNDENMSKLYSQSCYYALK